MDYTNLTPNQDVNETGQVFEINSLYAYYTPQDKPDRKAMRKAPKSIPCAPESDYPVSHT
jgi:hypothetical protein